MNLPSKPQLDLWFLSRLSLLVDEVLTTGAVYQASFLRPGGWY